jgi:alkylation response protein AidB-like acyl-CoA dehydrogenase
MTAFTFSAEQDALRATVRRFCEERSDLRRLMDTEEGFDPDVWKQLSAGLGLTAIAGFGDLAVVFEELGRTLMCVPYFSTVALAATAIRNTAPSDDLLPRIESGEVRATLAFYEDGWHAAAAIDGDKSYVIDGHTADVILVATRGGLYAVDGDAQGLTRAPLETLDPTRKQAKLTFDGVEARRLGTGGFEKTLHHAAVCLAAESTGGAERCLDMAVQYAKDRYQFGRPIGGFQAIKHMCADMLLRLESAKSAAYYAASVADEDSDELPVAASVAKAYCTEAFYANARANHQVHGGIGFTYEHDCHLYYRRAKSSELFLGDPSHHRELIAQRLGL